MDRFDFAGAFDKVPRRGPLHGLEYCGIGGPPVRELASDSLGKVSKCYWMVGPPVPILSGLPPGSFLGPFLFLIFMGDLLDNIKSFVRLFADDCVL